MSNLPRLASAHGVVISLFAVAILLGSLGIYEIAFFPVAVPAIQVDLGEASLIRNSTNSSAISLTAKNVGTDAVSLKTMLDNQSSLLSNDNSEPPLVASGQTATLGSSIANVASFRGVNGSILVPNSPTLDSPTLTIEVVFQYSSYNPDAQMIIGKGAAGGDSFFLFSYRSLGVVNDFVIYVNNTRYDQQLGDIFAVNSWYDVVFSVNGTSINAYVNGLTFESWQRPITLRANNNPLLMGACICGGYDFNGSMSSARLYDRAISPAEVRWNYENGQNPTVNGLKMWLSFDRGSNGLFPDLSGQNNSGAASGEVSVVTPLQSNRLYIITLVASTPSGEEYSTSRQVIAQGL